MSLSLVLAAASTGRALGPSAWRGAFTRVIRSTGKSLSPNGAAIAAMAGILGVGLGGPTRYAHGVVDKPGWGNSTVSAGVPELCLALAVVSRASWLAFTAAALTGAATDFSLRGGHGF